MFRRKSSSPKNFLLGAFLGGILGGMTALFFAPKSGTRLRKDLSKQCHAASRKMHGMVKDARKHSSEWVKEAHALAQETKKKLLKKR